MDRDALKVLVFFNIEGVSITSNRARSVSLARKQIVENMPWVLHLFKGLTNREFASNVKSLNASDKKSVCIRE